MSNLKKINKWKQVKRSGAFRRKVDKYKITLRSTTGMDKYFKSVLNHVAHTDVKTSLSNSDVKNNSDLLSYPEQKVVSIFHEENSSEEQDERFNWLEDFEFKEEICPNSFTELEKNTEFRKNIRLWAMSFNVPHLALKSLFKNINNRFPNTLPQDPRSLLKTYQTVVITKVGDGNYWHHGFEISLRQIFSKMNITPKSISCNLSIDGLPIYKSSKCEFWPILFNIHELPELRPMVIGIYCGKGKPTDLTAYLQPFVEETKVLLAEGLIINNVIITIKLRCFICDSPARAFIKGIINFNGKNGCPKCTTVGEYSHISHTVYFPRTGCDKRTDAGFRAKNYGAHHKQNSPLTLLPIDMIEDFPVGDSLHLIDLGIMKRCLLGWRDGSFGNYRTKWCAKDITHVSNFLENCKMPAEIHRSIRGLDVLCHWKGTEYRTFLYYLGVVILSDMLPPDIYCHFLKMFCAVTICSSNVYFNFLNLAENLLHSYVEYFRDFYGEDYMSSNVHNLTHLVDEVRKFGPLSSFNSYPFENRLYQIKNLLRNGNLPLAQVAKRMSEIMQCENDSLPHVPSPITKFPTLKSKHDDGFFYKIEFANFMLAADTRNKWFLTKDKNQVVAMTHVIVNEETLYISGNAIETLSNIFELPIRSSYLNIFKCSRIKTEISGLYSIRNIKCKLVAVEYNSTMYFFPLLHTLC